MTKVDSRDSLFDIYSRTDDANWRPEESTYEYLNRSSCAKVVEARVRLDLWYNDYPKDNRKNLASKFKLKDENHHLGAFWELFLHHWMLHRGMNPEVNKKTPDFWITAGGQRLAVEATTTHVAPSVPPSEMDKLHCMISDLKSSTHKLFYCQDVDKENKYRESFSRKHHAEIQRWVSELPATDNPAGSDIYHQPKRLRTNGVIFHCSPRRNESQETAFPFLHASLILDECKLHERIRRSVKDKAQQMGEHDSPTVIAINVADAHIDETDIENAFFGDEQSLASQRYMSNRTYFEESDIRAGNGTLGTLRNPKYKRVSGILVARDISSLTDFPIECHIYENPRADSEIPELPGQVREARTAWGELAYYRRTIELR